PISIGLVGTGEMGTDIVSQVSLMPGIRIAAIAEIDTEAVRKAIRTAELPEEAAQPVSGSNEVDKAAAAGRIAVATDYQDLCASSTVDVIIDATGSPQIGARLALAAFDNGKHLVMMNVETDVT